MYQDQDRNKQEDFLAKATEAAEMAEKAKRVSVREAWQRVAENYRALADLATKGGV